MRGTKRPTISVVIPVYNDERYICAAIKALMAQTYPSELTEIIIVDDGSTDRTASIVKAFDTVKYLHQTNQGPSTARNLGALKAWGQLVAFTDSDCEPDPDWLEKLVEIFEADKTGRVATVGGSQRGHPDDNEYARKVDTFLCVIGIIADYVKPDKNISRVSHNASCNSCYNRELYMAVGGFRPSMFPGEDVDLDKRLKDAGYTVLFTPHAAVKHHRADTPKRFKRMLLSYGSSSAYNVITHGFFRIIHLAPIAILLAAIALLAAVATGAIGIWSSLLTAALCLGMVACWIRNKSGLCFSDSATFTALTAALFTYGFWKFVIDYFRLNRQDTRKRLQPIDDTSKSDSTVREVDTVQKGSAC
jgi:succinoglycan biosynthesis protein ExoA